MSAPNKLSAISLQSSAGKADSRKLTSESSKKGFTLIELMVTIAIIAIISAVGMVVYSTAQKAGRVSKRVQDLRAIRTAIELYKTSVGSYPTQSVVATCANAGNASTGLASLVPTYMPAMPTDPLNNASNCYKYQSADGTEYKIWTSTDEMSANNYNTQVGMVDPARDGGATANCTLDAIPTGSTAVTTYAWAFYSSKGTTVGTDGCGY